MSINEIFQLGRRYPTPVQLLVAVSSIFAAYSLFSIGYFSRTPLSYVIIMGAWSTNRTLIEATTKILLSFFAAKLLFILLFGIARQTNLISYVGNIFYSDTQKAKLLRLSFIRFLRKNATVCTIIFGVFLFSAFAFNGIYGWFILLRFFTVLILVPPIMYPLFFRPRHLLFPKPFFIFPIKPYGASQDRWIIYRISCFSIILSMFLFFMGQSFFNSRAESFQTIQTINNTEVGSIIAVNQSGILILMKNAQRENWRYSEREFVFYPFSAILKISSQADES